jgi:hypothetical protein
MQFALAFQRRDLFIPSFFSGIFSEMDYENAQRVATSRQTPVSIFTHTPYLVEAVFDPYFLHLIPYTIVAARKDGELHVFTYQRKDDHPIPELRGKWSIGIDSQPSSLPDVNMGMLDILTHHASRSVFDEMGLDLDKESLHRCMSYASFLMDKSSEFTRSCLGVAHRVNLPSVPRLTPSENSGVLNGQWLDGETIQQMREDGLMDTWSEMLLEEEFV